MTYLRTNMKENSYMNIETRVITGKVRLSFINVFTPKQTEEGGKAKYGTAILIPKSDKETVKKIKDAIEAAKIKDKDKIANKAGNIPGDLKTPLNDGDLKADTYPEMEGHWIINAFSARRPVVVDRAKAPLTEDDDAIYSGVYARVALNFYGYNVKNKGIAAGLEAIQKLADGERLGGGAVSVDVFDDLDNDDDLL